jgi:arylsulfatase A-like enzyme
MIEQPFIVNNMTLKFTKETIHILNDFSERKTPFFIVHSYLKMHRPLYRSDAFSNCSDSDPFLCSLLELDWSIGKIMSTLESLGKDDDTLVILTSAGGPCVDTDGDCDRDYGHLATDGEKYTLLRGK